MSLFFTAVAVAFLCFAALSATAFGAYGDSAVHAFPLTGDAGANPPVPSYIGSSLTTELAGSTGAGAHTSYYFRVLLSAGDTFKGDFISSPTTDAPNGINLQVLVLPDVYPSKWISPSLTRVTYQTSKAGMFSLYVGTSLPSTFTVEPRIVPAVKVTLTAPLASGKPTHKKATTFTGSIGPAHKTSVTVTIQHNGAAV